MATHVNTHAANRIFCPWSVLCLESGTIARHTRPIRSIRCGLLPFPSVHLHLKDCIKESDDVSSTPITPYSHGLGQSCFCRCRFNSPSRPVPSQAWRVAYGKVSTFPRRNVIVRSFRRNAAKVAKGEKKMKKNKKCFEGNLLRSRSQSSSSSSSSSSRSDDPLSLCVNCSRGLD